MNAVRVWLLELSGSNWYAPNTGKLKRITVPGKVDHASQAAAIAKITEIAVYEPTLREHLNKVLGSPAFKGSRRSQEFLRHIVESSLEGNFSSLKERNLGMDLFGRAASYDTGDDAIVRVTASDVRKRLHQYYLETVEESDFRIQLPSGSYIPEFRRAVKASALLPPAPSNGFAETPQSTPPKESSASARRHTAHFALAGALLLIIGCALGLVLGRSSTTATHAAAGAHPDYSFYRDLLGPIVSDSQVGTELVLSNPPVLVYWGANGPDLPDERANRAFPVPAGMETLLARRSEYATQQGYAQHFFGFASHDYTGMGEAISAFYVSQVMQALNRRVRLTQARFLNWSAARTEHLILLGAPHMSFWTQESIQKANFTISKNEITNADPLPGERSVYSVQTNPETGEVREDYGLIWMSSSPSGARLLVLAGLSSTGTAGVGDFFGDPSRMRMVYDKLRASAKSKELPPNWQVLLKITSRDNVPVNVAYVAHRVNGVGR